MASQLAFSFQSGLGIIINIAISCSCWFAYESGSRVFPTVQYLPAGSAEIQWHIGHEEVSGTVSLCVRSCMY